MRAGAVWIAFVAVAVLLFMVDLVKIAVAIWAGMSEDTPLASRLRAMAVSPLVVWRKHPIFISVVVLILVLAVWVRCP